MPLAQPKDKIERRIGEKLFLKGERSFSPKSAVVRKPYPPGIHGKKMRRGRSDYSLTLREKQKVRRLYGIDDAVLRRYFGKARNNTSKSTVEMLAELLERRLDNTVYRLGFALSRSIARHLVSYGHILVNDRRVTSPAFQVRIGDNIALKESKSDSSLFQALDIRLKKYTPPEWLELQKNQRIGKVVRLPNLNDIYLQQNMALIVEYYSR